MYKIYCQESKNKSGIEKIYKQRGIIAVKNHYPELIIMVLYRFIIACLACLSCYCLLTYNYSMQSRLIYNTLNNRPGSPNKGR